MAKKNKETKNDELAPPKSGGATPEELKMAYKILEQNADIEAVYIVNGLYYAVKEAAKAAAGSKFKITTVKQKKEEGNVGEE